ncbi:FAD-dependent thymidylate synthase [Candidatus Saccharibacteria bacterium]|nr:FAD-dependent thymidylate synthase [Candidatus Saccharibacteria bacterium]
MTEQEGSRKGSFFVIEGTDGSGKGTQAGLLVDRLRKEGYDVELFDFPQYDKESSYFVKQYLNGVYGSSSDIGPYTGSLFYALDRFEASFAIKKALDENKVVIANRFTGSNMAHQGTKFATSEERKGFFIWLDNLEFEVLKTPRPDKSIVLRMPAEIAQKLVDSKDARKYTDKKRDIHEADIDHLRKSVEVYDDMCQLFPKDFMRIDCIRSGKLLEINEIHDYIWNTLTPLLPRKGNNPSVASQTIQKPESLIKEYNPFINKTDNGWEITTEGRTFLNEVVTNDRSNVYAFKDKLSALTVAAAMARLSRRGDDMRITILDEFAANMGKDESLLQRVITAYGDDSVQQLVGQHIVVEGASNLLTKQLEWGRLASYLEQSTRYIYFDEKDDQGNYKYFIPTNLPKTIKDTYKSNLDSIFKIYSKMVRELTDHLKRTSNIPKNERDGAWKAAIRAQACDAIRPVLPVATKSTVGIFASGQALESLIMRLRASESLEARETGDLVLNEARKVIPTFLERADKPDRGGATTAYFANTRSELRSVIMKNLKGSHSTDDVTVKLINYWPKNELDLLPHMIFDQTGLSLKEISDEVETWSIKTRNEVFRAYMGERLNRRHKPGRAIEQARYTWEIMCDYGIFRDLQRHRMVDDLEWQSLTPRYGYEVPQLVEDAGLIEEFETCFDVSAKLFSILQQSGFEYEAQYATLLGHKMRWTITYNAREAFHFHELRTSPQGHPGYRKLVQNMHELLAEKHPMLAEAMIFVNQGEDPELTRLAAERATQYKLEKLDNKNIE